MVNKKGWVRVAEAGIGALIIIGAILFIQTRGNSSPSETMMNQELSEAINEIGQDDGIRNKVIELDLGDDTKREEIEKEINESLRKMINNKYRAHLVKLCKPLEECRLLENEEIKNKEIFTVEKIISSNLERYSPKKIKIFTWNR